MAAGLGFKTFATGDILTAADANGYLMSQTVMVFADSAARSAAITSPQQGMISFLKSTNSMEYYNGTAWTPQDTGASPLTTKGDLYGYSTTNARVPIGTNGQVLTADSTQVLGLKWSTPPSGSMTLLSTTSLSGASTTISSISGSYKNLMVFIKNYRASSNFSAVVQINTDTTGSNYSSYVLRASSGSASPYADNATAGYDLAGYALSTGSTTNFAQLIFYDYANTGTYKTCEGVNIALDNNGSGKDITKGFTGWWSTSAINQLVIKTTVGTWSAGTVEIYGVN